MEIAITRPDLPDTGWVDRLFNVPAEETREISRAMEVPAVNIIENEKEFFLTIASPGLNKEEFNVGLTENLLTISAEKERNDLQERKGVYTRQEYNFSSWSRSFNLPEDVDLNNIEVEYLNGELRVIIPKIGRQVENLVKNIAVL